MPSHSKEIAERQRRQIIKWGKKQGILVMCKKGNSLIIRYKDGRREVSDFAWLIANGYVEDGTLNLTPKGELYYLQLQQMEWISKNPPEVRHAKAKARAKAKKEKAQADQNPVDPGSGGTGEE